MIYNRMYTEYEQALSRQNTVIHSYLKRLKAAQQAKNFKEICRLNRILYVLYSEKSELEQRAAELKEYIAADAKPQ